MRIRVHSFDGHETLLDAVLREVAEQTLVVVGDSGSIEWEGHSVRVVSSLAAPDLERRLGWLAGTYRVEGLEGVVHVRPRVAATTVDAVDDRGWQRAWRRPQFAMSICACGLYQDERHR